MEVITMSSSTTQTDRQAPLATSRNPATGALIATYAFQTPSEVERLLDDSAAAFRLWRATPMRERVAAYRRLAATLRERAEPLAALITAEMGKTIAAARGEVEKCASTIDWLADNGPAILADEAVAVDGDDQVHVSYLPIGTVLAVMPWNFPLWQVIRAAGPIMLSGNGFLLKHAPNVMGSAYALQAAYEAAGFPKGLFANLNCDNDAVGRAIEDERIAAVTLTGSMRAGSAVAATAGKALKRSLLELGGADAFIVEQPIAEEFTRQFVAAARQLKTGDPLDPTSNLGPMARADLRDELHQQVVRTIAAGATLVLGGHKLDGPGNFYAPTVLTGVLPGMAAFDEETFGPVAAISVADNAEHAIVLTNTSDYGLGGSLWTSDIGRAQRIARRLETGGVFINGFSASNPRIPVGGVKKSGYGRELSHFGLREFTNAQAVWAKTVD